MSINIPDMTINKRIETNTPNTSQNIEMINNIIAPDNSISLLFGFLLKRFRFKSLPLEITFLFFLFRP